MTGGKGQPYVSACFIPSLTHHDNACARKTRKKKSIFYLNSYEALNQTCRLIGPFSGGDKGIFVPAHGLPGGRLLSAATCSVPSTLCGSSGWFGALAAVCLMVKQAAAPQRSGKTGRYNVVPHKVLLFSLHSTL